MHSIEWAAGLFEGEGSVSKRKNQFGAQMSLQMTDKDVVELFRNVVGVGNIYECCVQKPHHKPSWKWQCGAKDDVRYVLGKFLPYLGQRRAYKALNILDDLELA